MKLYLLLLLLLCISPLSKSKEIAITFDDSPRKAEGYFNGPNRAKKLIEELKNHQVQQVAFFSNSKRLDAEGIQRLKAYNQAGHIIANHTHNHPDFNKISLEQYVQSFLLADAKLSQFKGWKIISPEEAYTDAIAQYQPQQIFPYNPGRIGEIARDKGQKKGLWHKTLDEKYLDKRFTEEVLNPDSANLNISTNTN
ncbi:polysaccharide deacetylase family protein [Thalassotalea sp. ND16A]|uniref:polysaccharide deacetylase family protein n=1 Tax=Thalassotalea sp. ND16A TaxID=1535422 RepID=UPI00051D42F2|nr:polysaccharide deacetylase family protein [Thalassotalea sp. ND16A]KGJ89441.1 hypothetical protein ND16A_2334 [Thalassotalea sp. ND16A]